MTDDRRDDPFDIEEEDRLLDLPLGHLGPSEDAGYREPEEGPAEPGEGPYGVGGPDGPGGPEGPGGPSGPSGPSGPGVVEEWRAAGSAESDEPPRPQRNRLARYMILAFVTVILAALAGLVGYLLPRPSPALVRVAPTAVDFGARSVAGAGGSMEVTLTSTGERPAEVESVEVVAAAPEGPAPAGAEEGGAEEGEPVPGASVGVFEVASDACSGSTVAPEKSCVVAVSFQPAGAGAVRALLRLDGDFANAPLEIPLLGEGVAPHLRLDRERVDFGARPVDGAQGEEVVTLANDGTAPLDLDAVVITGADAEDFTVASAACTGRPLAPGKSCPVSVGFKPTAEGQRQATLTIRPGPGSRGVRPPAVALAGSGLPRVPSGRLAVAGPAGAAEDGLGFGAVPVGRTVEKTLELANRGDRALASADLAAVVDDDAFAVADNRCASAGALAPGATCEIVVRFAPPADRGAGDVTGVVRVGVAGSPGESGAGETGVGEAIEVALRGQAVVPRLAPRPGQVDFGESRVGRGGPTREITLASTGSGAVEIGSVGLAGPDPGAFAVRSNGCDGKTLASGESCTLVVGFQPRQEGVQSARLEARSPVLDQAVTVALRGAGAAPRVAFSPRELAFGRVPATRSDTRTLTVTSAGRVPLEVRRIDLVGPDAAAFEVTKEDCTEALTLAPGDTCRVSVRFAPTREGQPSARLAVTHDGEGSPAEVQLTGTALPAPVPRFAVTPGRVAFGTVAVGGRSDIETVTVKNSGTERLVLGDVRLAGAAAGDFHVVPGSCAGAPYVSPGSECTIGVRFTPTAAGSGSAELVIPHNAAGGQGRVRLSGDGVAGGGSGAP